MNVEPYGTGTQVCCNISFAAGFNRPFAAVFREKIRFRALVQ